MEKILEGNARLAEGRLMHPHQDAFFALCEAHPLARKGWHEQLVRGSLLKEALDLVDRRPNDRYISQASFVLGKRSAALVHSLSSAFVDLDVQQQLGIAPDAGFVARALARAEEVGIPLPSLVICSGRGLYLKWYFEQPIDAGYLPHWRALNSGLVKLFAALGSDTKVKDPARVLRLIGTLNTKADGRSVTVEYDSGAKHNFSSLCAATTMALARYAGTQQDRDLVQRARDKGSIPRMGAARAIAKDLNILAEVGDTDLKGLMSFEAARRPLLTDEHGNPAGQFTTNSLNWRRFVDLRNLIIMRGGAPEGCRDEFVFWMLNHLALSGQVNPSNFDAEARSLIMLFPHEDGFDPLTEGHLSTLARKIQEDAAGVRVEFNGQTYRPIYTPKTQYLIDTFAITPEEESKLGAIISDSEKQRRADMKVPGRADRRERRLTLRETLVKRLVDAAKAAQTIGERSLSEVLSPTEIAATWGVTERHARRLIKSAVSAAMASLKGACDAAARLLDGLINGRASQAARTAEARQQEVLRLHAQGAGTASIASQVGLSMRQVQRILSDAKSTEKAPDVPASNGFQRHPIAPTPGQIEKGPSLPEPLPEITFVKEALPSDATSRTGFPLTKDKEREGANPQGIALKGGPDDFGRFGSFGVANCTLSGLAAQVERPLEGSIASAVGKSAHQGAVAAWDPAPEPPQPESLTTKLERLRQTLVRRRETPLPTATGPEPQHSVAAPQFLPHVQKSVDALMDRIQHLRQAHLVQC